MKTFLGRYEYFDEAKNSDKYWICKYDRKTKTYTTEWGRNGNPSPNGTKEGLSETEAFKKISEKIAKGYKHVDGREGPMYPKTPKRPKTKKAGIKKASAPLKKLLDENAEISPSEFMAELKKMGEK
jgi:predicted DNA-binding WGR domain protein